MRLRLTQPPSATSLLRMIIGRPGAQVTCWIGLCLSSQAVGLIVLWLPDLSRIGLPYLSTKGIGAMTALTLSAGHNAPVGANIYLCDSMCAWKSASDTPAEPCSASFAAVRLLTTDLLCLIAEALTAGVDSVGAALSSSSSTSTKTSGCFSSQVLHRCRTLFSSRRQSHCSPTWL